MVVPLSRTLPVFSSRSPPVTATLASVPPLLVVDRIEPAVWLTVPPLIVPPNRFQVPVAASRVSVEAALFKVPLRFTVPPVRVKPAKLKPEVENVPPRLKVAEVIDTVPAELHEPPKVRVLPLAAVIEAGLVQLLALTVRVPAVACNVALLVNVLLLIVSVRPAASAVIRPSLIRVAVAKFDKLRLPPQPGARRTTPAAPMVIVPAVLTASCTVRVPVVAPSATTSEFRT